MPRESPRPFVKWAGGKNQLLDDLLPLFPAKFETYYEPLCGGAAVFFALAREGRFRHAVLADTNRELMQTYEAIQQDVEWVIKHLEVYAKAHSEKYYYEVRAQHPRSLAGIAARMIYLNRTGFNGLYRVNRQGEFNVPFGRYTNPQIVNRENLYACSVALQKVSLYCTDFELVIANTQSSDVVYFDPPYLPVDKGSFTSYDRNPFGVEEHERLAKCFKAVRKTKARVVLTNSSCPETHRIYKGCRTVEVDSRRSINSKGDARGPVKDVIVVGGPGPWIRAGKKDR